MALAKPICVARVRSDSRWLVSKLVSATRLRNRRATATRLEKV